MPLDEPDSSECAAPWGRARYSSERISIRREAVRLEFLRLITFVGTIERVRFGRR